MSYSLPKECCSGFSNIDFSKAELPMMYIDWSDINLWIALGMIIFNPLYWNMMARLEYRTRALSRAIRSRHVACCLLAASIFGLGIFRDIRFKEAMDSQPQWYYLHQNWALWSGYMCLCVGTILVVASYLALGFYGTFLGDYFGILMKKRVTGFPFNILDNPMYWGSTLNFLGGALVFTKFLLNILDNPMYWGSMLNFLVGALVKGSQAGVLMSIVVGLVYKTAISFEGPFTTKIYAEHSRGHKKAANKQA